MVGAASRYEIGEEVEDFIFIKRIQRSGRHRRDRGRLDGFDVLERNRLVFPGTQEIGSDAYRFIVTGEDAAGEDFPLLGFDHRQAVLVGNRFVWVNRGVDDILESEPLAD